MRVLMSTYLGVSCPVERSTHAEGILAVLGAMAS